MINIVTNDNGYGLSENINQWRQALDSYMPIKFTSYGNLTHAHNKKHIFNLFDEVIDSRFFKQAEHQLFSPHPEWSLCRYHPSRIRLTLCKTHHAETIYQKKGYNTFYTGFSTRVDFQPHIPRKPEFIHVAGKSIFRGTETVVRVWRENPKLPILHLFTTIKRSYLETIPHNIKLYLGYRDEKELSFVRNSCMYALQPSASEGFGHTIWQALGAGCHVITTDAEPMNEILGVTLVKADCFGHRLDAKLYAIQAGDLSIKIEHLLTQKEFNAENSLDIFNDAHKSWQNNIKGLKVVLEGIRR